MIAGAVGVVVLRNPFYSVLALVAHLLSLAVLFLLLRAEFVAAVQVVVYAGAVMVLYVFVVAYVGGESELARRAPARASGPVGSRPARSAARSLGGALLVELLIALLGTGLKAIDGYGARYAPGPRTLRHARLHRQAAADALPARVRGRLVPAARSPPSAGSCSRAGAAASTRRTSATRSRRSTCCARRDRHDGRGSRDAAARRVPADDGSPSRRRRSGGGDVSIAWYLAVSAIVFALGAVGVMTRRNPLVVLLCLELMLNGGNLALIAFSRMWGNGDGQILALVVMTVAACEVCIGLGMIVAIYRRQLPIDVDELRELQG